MTPATTQPDHYIWASDGTLYTGSDCNRLAFIKDGLIRLAPTVPAQVDVALSLTADEALALAQLCKRIGFQDCRGLAQDKGEAYTMLDAITALRHALADLGYQPR